MNKKRLLSTSLSFLALAVIAGPFQNCGPAAEQGAQNFSASEELRVADGWNSGEKVSFLEKRIDVESDGVTVDLLGICQGHSDGKALYWQVVLESSGEVIDGGLSSCEKGGFKFSFEGVDGLVCGKDYTVMVSSEEGSDDQTILHKFCDFVAEGSAN